MTLNEIINLLGFDKNDSAKIIEAECSLHYDEYNEFVKNLTEPESYESAENGLIALLSPDIDGIKILKAMLYSACLSYDKYRQKSIPENIFVETMGCFKRFTDEYKTFYNRFGFDRSFWVGRQLSLMLFRIGVFEYEMPFDVQNNKEISIHIPSQADISIDSVTKSVFAAKEFFKKFYPQYNKARYVLTSWLLSPCLKEILPKDSKILALQNIFDIKEGKQSSDYRFWVYRNSGAKVEDLPEKTTLQKGLKSYLLKGNTFKNGFGVLKDTFLKKIIE